VKNTVRNRKNGEDHYILSFVFLKTVVVKERLCKSVYSSELIRVRVAENWRDY
jgi:hypothetical protein